MTKNQEGGKVRHLKLLRKGGFNTPDTYTTTDRLEDLPEGLYVVRSSSEAEDSLKKTAAGQEHTELHVAKKDIPTAIEKVLATYEQGDVAIQPDLTNHMEYSGVGYTNLNGSTTISMGKGNQVHDIVNGKKADTEITSNSILKMKGKPIKPQLLETITTELHNIEEYFGRPMELEFFTNNDEMTDLQARPLPNLTDKALKEHEGRRLTQQMRNAKAAGIEDYVLGIGNYREILGNEHATPLSASLFNYIFTGDGQTTMGAVQLGRNELGYNLRHEIFPWVTMIGGKVYYNFVGDALQFRPQGIALEDFIEVINKTYLPQLRADHKLLNYPELQLYIQFPDQAREAGLDPQPYEQLVERNREAIRHIKHPTHAPKKTIAATHTSLEACLTQATKTADHIRTQSAKEYVKAARLAFFALEDLKHHLEQMQTKDKEAFKNLSELFGTADPTKLRDAIAYDESISSFELEEQEENRYLGSFELTLPRGYPPKRHYKKGRELPDKQTRKIAESVRHILSYREKNKFFLLRDYDYLGQLYEQAGELSGLGKAIYQLRYEDLHYASEEPILAEYRIDLEQQLHGKDLFGEPHFEHAESYHASADEHQPELIFGRIQGTLEAQVNKDCYVVNDVDQTVSIPKGTNLVMVPNNIRPGSHLFTVLSDYELPVIAMPAKDLKEITDKKVAITQTKDGINIAYRP